MEASRGDRDRREFLSIDVIPRIVRRTEAQTLYPYGLELVITYYCSHPPRSDIARENRVSIRGSVAGIDFSEHRLRFAGRAGLVL